MTMTLRSHLNNGCLFDLTEYYRTTFRAFFLLPRFGPFSAFQPDDPEKQHKRMGPKAPNNCCWGMGPKASK